MFTYTLREIPNINKIYRCINHGAPKLNGKNKVSIFTVNHREMKI